MHRYPRWPIHAALILVSFVMLVPFYWVLKTSLTGENIFAYPPSILPQGIQPFFFVEAWYAIPFARFFLNSVVVASMVIVANLIFNAAAGYALTKDFWGKRTILLVLPVLHDDPVPRDHHPGLSDHRQPRPAQQLPGPGPARLLAHHLHLHLQGEFRRHPAVPDPGRADRRRAGVEDPAAGHAAARQARDRDQRDPLVHLVVERFSLAPDHHPRRRRCRPCRSGLSTFLAYFEDTTGALYAFCVMVLVPGLLIFLLAQNQFIQGLTSGARKG